MKKLLVFYLAGLIFSINMVAQIPVVQTVDVTIISLNEVTSGGIIVSDGGLPITSKGILWSQDSLLILGENDEIPGGAGSEDFISNISGLFPRYTYFLRAYAVNSAGIGYGNVLAFTTLSYINFGTVQDIEGNVYKTVLIDNQNWMAENLKTVTFNDGSPIPNVTDNLEWSRLTNSAYCWYDNDEETYKNKYGALYNYFAVTDSRGICPSGWHIPNEAEWQELHCCYEDYSPCEEDHRDCYLREGGTNETGFSARNGGVRQALNAHHMSPSYGRFRGIGYSAFFWELTGDFYCLFYNDAVNLYHEWVFDHSPMNGYSVRCLENKEITINTYPQNIPRDSILEVPVFSNASPVDSFISYQFEYCFDNELMQFEDCNIGQTLSSNGSLEINATQNKLSIAWASPTPITESGVLIKLYFRTIKSGNTIPSISKFLINADTIREVTNGTITIHPGDGDIDDNGSIQAYDAALALQYSVGMDPLPDIDPYPWENWRFRAGNVDRRNDISAYDASLILQYTVGIINSFPVQKKFAKSAIESQSDVKVTVDNGIMVFRSSGDIKGLNVRLEENSELFGSPVTPVAGALLASNFTSTNISVGLAMAKAPAENEVILTIPVIGIPEMPLVLNLLINNNEKQINLGMLTDISEISQNTFEMYPNPANTILYFKNCPKGASVSVFDLNGRKIKSCTVTENQIDISDLATGIYSVQIISDNKALTKKLIKE